MRFDKKTVLRSKPFWSVLAVFLAANFATLITHPGCCDRFDGIGFPLPFHLSGGIAGVSNFYPIGLTLNLLIALTLALIAARIGLYFGSRK
jgi:hypothetical protein